MRSGHVIDRRRVADNFGIDRIRVVEHPRARRLREASANRDDARDVIDRLPDVMEVRRVGPKHGDERRSS